MSTPDVFTVSLGYAVSALSQVDFSLHPGLYDRIPWAELEAATISILFPPGSAEPLTPA